MKKICSIIGILVCLAIIIVGITLGSANLGMNTAESTSFGGDFYTYSYKVTRYAANNVAALARFIQRAVSWIMVAIGAIGACFFGIKLDEVVQQRKSEERNLSLKNDLLEKFKSISNRMEESRAEAQTPVETVVPTQTDEANQGE